MIFPLPRSIWRAVCSRNQLDFLLYSVGVGMAQNAIFAVNAGPILKHLFDISTPSYWIAAMNDVKQGDVLYPNTIFQKTEMNSPPNVYSLRVTYDGDNTWTVVPN